MTWAQKDQIRRGVESMLQVNLAVRDGESVLVMTDLPPGTWWQEKPLPSLQDALERSYLARLVANLVAELYPETKVEFLPYAMTEPAGSEPNVDAAMIVGAFDIIIAINTHSLTHTNMIAQACANGSRVASMPGFLAEMFEGPMTADYDRIAEDSGLLAGLLTEASLAVVTTPHGTDLRLDLRGRSGDVDIGLIRSPGKCDNLPGGEAFIAPVEGQSEGKLVVNPEGFAGLDEPMTLYFEAGSVSRIEGGGAIGGEFCRLLELPSPQRQMARRNLAELGIGTNPKAASVQSTLEAEKIKGTVHVAIGDNAHIGGLVEADLHQDFVVWQPDLLLDGEPVIRSGKWLI
jgi:leucyl aminopeptidase (aminopeptidase T)